jgi:hypothetical protein
MTISSAAWIAVLVAVLAGFVFTGSWVFLIAFVGLATIGYQVN